MKQIGGCFIRFIMAAICILAVPMILFPEAKSAAAPVTLEAVARAGAIIPIVFIGFLAVACIVFWLGSDPGDYHERPPVATGNQPVLGSHHFTRRPAAQMPVSKETSKPPASIQEIVGNRAMSSAGNRIHADARNIQLIADDLTAAGYEVGLVMEEHEPIFVEIKRRPGVR